MKKLLLAVISVSFVSSVSAADFSLNKLNVKNVGLKAEGLVIPSVPAPKQDTAVPQDLVNKFTQVKNDLWRLQSDTTWLRSDINRLESEALRITQNNSNPFFQNDLRQMASDMSRYDSDAQRISYAVSGLLSVAQKSPELNKLAQDMDWDARTLLNTMQFDVERSAQNLENTVRRLSPALVGYDAQWKAMDITRYSRDLTWKLRTITSDIRTLLSRTQP
ncbi:MAG TPA: hypothetical protein DCZ92_14005 [Elusimicrobia bacterium]|nr:MAG: hypothetical protein A2016_05425 [Elusimicrobia bacterium GWF2_62_30]HBA61895.1 hypothetical protein [Elusimicrobiota bacterium]